MNDGSTDGSLAALSTNGKTGCRNVTVLEQENQGVSVARNTGMAAASGKYLAFPDIDDKFYPGMYRTLLEMAERAILMSRPAMAAMCTKAATTFIRFSAGTLIQSTGVLPGYVWLKQALDSRKFLHVTVEHLSPRFY